ncbi:MAG: helix-turn-helix domain-containing protein [Eubacteriales bacterium]|jgi:AraC-like DNA-binding protein
MLEIAKLGIFDSRGKFHNLSRTPPRVTELIELEYYLSGDGASFVDGVSYPHAPDNLLYVRPGQTRWSTSSADGNDVRFTCFYIHLAPDEMLLDLTRDIPAVMPSAHHAEIRELFGELLRLSAVRGSELLLHSRIYELLSIVQTDARAYRMNLTGYSARAPYDPAPVEAAIRFIEDNLAQPITLADIAAAANLSPVYFHKRFRLRTGRTPREFLLERRIARARQLLLTTDLPVSLIAERCGFSSQSYFNDRFKKVCSLTPSGYRSLRYVPPYGSSGG